LFLTEKLVYNQDAIENLISFLKANGRLDKTGLSKAVQKRFELILDRSVFSCADFSIRFCHAASKIFSNTVLSLSALQKYDDKPFIVCIVTQTENFPLLANTTLLSKISHSSHQLRTDNIKGSFNGSDIMRTIEGIENKPENFEALFLMHKSFSFEENLERLVEKTNAISPTGKRFEPSLEETILIKDAPVRAKHFLLSNEYIDLRDDLGGRIKKVQNEIAIAAFIDNVNIRGRIIEYLITSDGGTLKEQIIDCLRNKKLIPQFKTEDKLGDYWKDYKYFSTATEIKTKVLFLASNPKGYNVDKLLAFLAEPNSIYMIYIVGIGDDGNIKAVLCSVFDKQLLDGTVSLSHWAGRNSRGVTQFMGNSLIDILNNPKNTIETNKANRHIEEMLSL